MADIPKNWLLDECDSGANAHVKNILIIMGGLETWEEQSAFALACAFVAVNLVSDMCLSTRPNDPEMLASGIHAMARDMISTAQERFQRRNRN